MDQSEYTIREVTAERILARSENLGQPPFDPGTIGGLFAAVAQEITALGGHPVLGIGLFEDTGAGTRVTCGYRASDSPGIPFGEYEAIEMPAATAAILTHRGSVDGIAASWQKLTDWCHQQDYRLSGPCREIYLEAGDRVDDSDQSDWVVELQQPIVG